MKQIKSNYALVNLSTSTIELNKFEPYAIGLDFSIKNVVILINDDSTIQVTGEKILWSFTSYKKFIEDMENIPNEKYVKFGYKTFYDFLKGIKKPYVSSMSWYKLQNTEPFKCMMSKWNIII